MKKLLLSFIGIFASATLFAQSYPDVPINQINFVSQQALQNCVDTSAYVGDTVTTVGIVITPGNLSEVASTSITGGSRPFIALRDTVNGGAVAPFSGIIVMGADPSNNPLSKIENASAGDVLEITGIISSFNGLIQLQPLDQNAVSLVGLKSKPSFSTVPAGDLQDQNGNNVLTTGENGKENMLN